MFLLGEKEQVVGERLQKSCWPKRQENKGRRAHISRIQSVTLVKSSGAQETVPTRPLAGSARHRTGWTRWLLRCHTPFWDLSPTFSVVGAIQRGRWLAHHLNRVWGALGAGGAGGAGGSRLLAQIRSEPPRSPGRPLQRVLGFVSAFPTRLTRNDPRARRGSRSRAAGDCGRGPLLPLGSRAQLVASRSAPPPSAWVLTSDWLLETPPPPISEDSWKARLLQADQGYSRPVPGLQKRLRIEKFRDQALDGSAIPSRLLSAIAPVRRRLSPYRTGLLLSDWLFAIPPRPLVGNHLGGFQLLSGILQFLPIHEAVEASWPASLGILWLG